MSGPLGGIFFRLTLYTCKANVINIIISTHQGDDVDQDLVAENVDVKFTGDVSDQLHEHVLVSHVH